MLAFLRGPQVSKISEIDQEIAFYVMKHKPLLKPRSHRFWHDYNLSKHVPVAFATFFAMGTCFDEVKMQEMLEKGL